uniref:Uncharacterized protein n=1 Tax=Vespula pensylvanica TaxID=30213 RepID=A0A834U8M1_VESPE|nr:hypothetical protein H0235_009608 [Vespula pensylvanica]
MKIRTGPKGDVYQRKKYVWILALSEMKVQLPSSNSNSSSSSSSSSNSGSSISSGGSGGGEEKAEEVGRGVRRNRKNVKRYSYSLEPAVSQPVSQSASQPVSQSASQSVSQSVNQSVSQLVSRRDVAWSITSTTVTSSPAASIKPSVIFTLQLASVFTLMCEKASKKAVAVAVAVAVTVTVVVVVSVVAIGHSFATNDEPVTFLEYRVKLASTRHI